MYDSSPHGKSLDVETKLYWECLWELGVIQKEKERRGNVINIGLCNRRHDPIRRLFVD